jgi:hypothetical protein
MSAKRVTGQSGTAKRAAIEFTGEAISEFDSSEGMGTKA